jgi:excisionase family DNA binding protein
MNMNRDASETEWMTTSAVARRLGYSTAWVRQQIASGRLAAQQHHAGNRRSFRIRRSDLDRFVTDTFEGS